jgi:hypothetical protein
LSDRKHKNIRELLISICSFFLSTVSQSQLAVFNKRPKFGPRVATQAWWIDRIKEDPIYQYTEEWAKHSEYQVARWKILAELDYKVLGTSILRGAPELGQAYPPKIEVKPFWFKPLIGADIKVFQLWSWLEATKSLGLPISEEADKWYRHTSTEDLRKEPSSYLASSKKSLLLSGTITKGASTNWYTLQLLSLSPLFWIFL